MKKCKILSLEYGVWSVENGVWSVEFRVLSVELGAENSQFSELRT